jgi:hypothetical protein
MNDKRLCICLAAMAALAACSDSLDLRPAGNQGARAQGKGFSVAVPVGKDWYAAEGVADGVEYFKIEGGVKKDIEDAPHTFFAGVFPLPAGDAASVNDAGFAKAAENLLGEYLSRNRRVLQKFSVSPYPAKRGICVQYDALQIQTRSVQNPTRQPLEFASHGIVCRYSTQSPNWIHGFYTRRYFTGVPSEPAKTTLQEAEAFLQSVELSPP